MKISENAELRDVAICSLHNNLPANLKLLRTIEGLTQEEVSEIVMISRSAYNRIESGYRTPDLQTLCLISRYYGVNIDLLLGNDPNDL